MKQIDKSEFVEINMQLKVIEAHTMGEPLRLITEGFPDIKGNSMMEKQIYFEKYYDQYRKGILLEPYGHKDMFGAILTSKIHDEADFGVLFMNTQGMEPMCGHGSIAVAVIAVKYGLVKMEEPITEVRLDVPAGIVTLKLMIKDGKIINVLLQNVESYYIGAESVDVDGEIRVLADLAFGGNVFAVVNADDAELTLTPKNKEKIIKVGMKIKSAINDKNGNETVLGTVFYSKKVSNAYYKDTVVFGDGSIDRSPCGTGCSALISVLRKKRLLEVGQEITVQSIIGTNFGIKIESESKINGTNHNIPIIRGNAYIIGEGVRFFDGQDPIEYGFQL